MTATRARILAATTDLFRARGFNGTGLKEVTASAGATTGSLYHFFPGGKDDLARTVIGESGAEHLELFEAIAAAAAGPAEAIEDFFVAAAAALEGDGFIDLCPIGTVAGEIASSHDDLRRAADQTFASWIEAVARHLVRAGLGAAEAGEVATTIVAALQGGFLLVRCRRDGGSLRIAGRQLRALVDARIAAASAAQS